MEAALRNPEELACFVELLRISHDYDRLQAWMWIRVINEMRLLKTEDRAAKTRQIRNLWNTYLSEDGAKAVSIEMEKINEWGAHIAESLPVIEALLLVDLQKVWTEYSHSSARKKFTNRTIHRSQSERQLRHKVKKLSPKLGRRASESCQLRNSVEIQKEFLQLGVQMRVE